ncbi:MAG: class I SAM-dependent methyltransferase [Chloroflexi bacterium AL-W]|nr:class I SAM-dependent methyltransferase [Chloroflexi bacterium AL-N1]NOK68935.1 class I SAM-dependent methyltransferase [Chloroflexi bacterium AL-N10]NOK76918.1 class I SAM-dependent methyltransferase [Chloroflexi bacterium AL-N5]NOK82694.1 class I SAM-dependent methyltransferase [Chloroflexi bacterium AL-W]NOK90775.1 class I SAM-dependent methyltransferase [Chloroflexi bacterium AL-N15]
MNAIESVSFHFGDYQWLNPIQIGTTTLKNKGSQISTITHIINVLHQLQGDDYTTFMERFYESGIERFGEHWGYNDQLTILYAAATFLKPENYLEIGVFRGRSMSVVAHTTPTCNMYGFDMWIDNYSGLQNPGTAFVESQLQRVGHQGQASFTSGNSKETVPAFFERNPDLFFDLITVDGDHSEEGAKIDIENVLPRLKVGGVLVFDDISHPQFPWLERAWDDLIGKNPDFVSEKYTEVGHGVAFAVRRSTHIKLDQVNEDLFNRLTQLTTQIRNLNAEQQIVHTILVAKEEYEDSLNKALVAKDQYTQTLQSTIETQTKALEETVTAKDTYIDSLQETLSTKETYEASLQELIKTREDYASSLQDALVHKDEYITSLSTVLQAREDELVHAKEYISSLESHLQKLQDYINASENNNSSQG